TAWLNRDPDGSAPVDGPLGRARRAEALALLGSCEVERAAQALTGSIATLEAEMEEDADAVVPLRDTVARLAAARTDLEAERQRLAEEHRARKAERIALEEAPAGTGPASTRPDRPDRSFRAT